jgi:hypothetical protein
VDAVRLWDLDRLEVLRWALGRSQGSCEWPCMSPPMRDFDVHGESVLIDIAASKANGHGSALGGRARLQETVIEAVRIMVRSGAVDGTLRRVRQRECCTEVEL